MFSNPPECDKPSECRIISQGGTTTLMGWTEVYDRAGNRVSGSDPNKTTWHFRCQTCGKSWSETK